MTSANQVKRIIITGASGVGKTSLALALSEKLSLPLIPEIGRRLCQEMGFEKIGDIPDQEGFKRRVLELQIEHEDKHQSFLADRSAIDSWVLWQRWNICSAMTYDSESFYRVARSRADNYTHVIYIPPMFDPPEDGLRWTDSDYQKQIDRMVRTTLYDWDLWSRTYTVKSEDMVYRLQEVVAWLSNR